MHGEFHLNRITLNGGSRPRLDDVTATIPAGRTAIVGYSGAGKTSLLNVLAGFEIPDAGNVVRNSVRRESGKTSGGRLPMFWVPQNGGLWPHLTVDQHLNCTGTPESSDKLLISLDLAHRRSALPAELSLGERSRLALARALSARADVLLLDEPLSHVDPVRKPAYWSVLRDIVSEESIFMLFTSHEPETVLRHSEYVICLQDGRVSFQGTTTSLNNAPPNREVGEFLGPLNWFDGDEAACFLTESGPSAGSMAIRPERLMMLADAKSPIELVSMPFRGGYAESIVRDVVSGRTRTILHQVSGDVPLQGQRVRLSVVGDHL